MTDVSLQTVNRLHNVTTAFHVFIYFCPEAAASYAKVGIEGRAGYFGSRTAAMGELSTEMVIATFYNFSPDVVAEAMDGLWATASAEELQLARWRAVAEVLDTTCQPDGGEPALSDADVDEAIALCQRAVDGLAWDGRPLAAGNQGVMELFDRSEFADDKLVRLWQLVTIIREWRGDAHIGLLVAEPLSGAECTVITHAQRGGFTKASRAWPDEMWDTAVARLTERGVITGSGDEVSLTDEGKTWRQGLEDRTDRLAAPIWAGFDDAEVNRLGDLLQPLVDAIAQGGYLKPIGIRPAE